MEILALIAIAGLLLTVAGYIQARAEVKAARREQIFQEALVLIRANMPQYLPYLDIKLRKEREDL